ncbi:TolB family protein [Kitasatospora setae]|uniref:TolB family protein n=1 Tax=Kitasatospora setae TaxID=2066 RepID=UPI00069053DE|nr:PD40 domain-containing protein [Kitasatospora setae]
MLNPFSDENAKPLPQTGNLWPNVGGRYAKSVYANRNDGQVYIRDEYLQQNGAAATRGSQPDLSNDGDLVFVRVVDGHDHLFTKTGGYDGEERDLTPNATVHYTEPAFSPDGKTIAFRGPDGTYTIPTKGGTPTKVSDTSRIQGPRTGSPRAAARTAPPSGPSAAADKMRTRRSRPSAPVPRPDHAAIPFPFQGGTLMSERIRLRRSAAALLVAAVTTGSALLLTACDPEGADSAAGTSAPSAATTASAAATGSGSGSGSAPAKPGGSLNKTAGTRLTISTGTATVLMDGKSVDFGTVVRDLAWSPDGKHAAFVDGAGNLQTADPKKALRLMSVEAKAGGKPEPLSVGDSEGASIPQTGNQWPSSNGHSGMTVYANKDDGKVYFHDVVSRTNGGDVTKGSQPSLADEGDLVFVRSVNGHSHIFTSPAGEGKKEADLTPGASVDYTEPAISHDGRTVAFRGPDGVYTVPFAGGKPERVSDAVGLPAYR